MCGILIAIVVLAAIVGSVLHVSAGWALIVVVVAAIVVFAIVQARNPNRQVHTGRPGLLFTNICPGCKRHNKTGARRCAHCGTDLIVAPAPPAEAEKTCPDCAESVLAAARKCRYCGHEFSSAAAPST